MQRIRDFLGEHRFWAAAGAAALVLGAYYFFSGNSAPTAPAAKAEITTAKRGNLEVAVNGSGQVNADSQVDIRPQVAGDGMDILRIAVKNNQAVKKGDLIAVLDYEDAQKEVRDANLSLLSSEVKLKQTKKAYSSQDEDDRWSRQLQEIAVDQARNRLSDAREKLQDYYVRAPFDGIVTGLDFEAGDSVARTETLASVITDKLIATVSLTEVDVVGAKSGQKAELTFDAIDGLVIEGEVVKIDTIGKVSQNVVYYEAEIAFEDAGGQLRPGMSVSADILTAEKPNVLLVPSGAVKSNAKGEYVIVQKERAPGGPESAASTEEVAVKSGATDGISTEIVDGLKEGETVVVQTAAEAAANSSAASNQQNQGLFNMFRPGGGGGRRDR